MALSFDIPDIARTPPAGICWPFVGDVILTPCEIEDADEDNDGDAAVDGEDVIVVLMAMAVLLVVLFQMCLMMTMAYLEIVKM